MICRSGEKNQCRNEKKMSISDVNGRRFKMQMVITGNNTLKVKLKNESKDLNSKKSNGKLVNKS